MAMPWQWSTPVSRVMIQLDAIRQINEDADVLVETKIFLIIYYGWVTFSL